MFGCGRISSSDWKPEGRSRWCFDPANGRELDDGDAGRITLGEQNAFAEAVSTRRWQITRERVIIAESVTPTFCFLVIALLHNDNLTWTVHYVYVYALRAVVRSKKAQGQTDIQRERDRKTVRDKEALIRMFEELCGKRDKIKTNNYSSEVSLRRHNRTLEQFATFMF